MGVASIQSEDDLPECKEMLKKRGKYTCIVAISLAHSFKTFGFTEFWPAALCGFESESSLNTPLSVTVMLDIGFALTQKWHCP